MPVSLKVAGLTKSYAGHTVLDQVTFDCLAAERVVILGESGVGKTTALKLIAGLDNADAGSVWIGGKEVTHLPSRVRGVGFVFQDHALWPGKTVYDHLRLPLTWKGRGRQDDKIERTLSLVRLSEKRDRRPEELSGGQRQRVAIARALVSDPEVVLMDEPFSDLDPLLRTSLRRDVLGLQEELRFCLIFVTHDCQEALELGEKIIIMRGGKIIQAGAPKELMEKPGSAYVARFLGYQNVFPAVRRNGHSQLSVNVPDLSLDGLTLKCPATQPASRLAVVFPAGSLTLSDGTDSATLTSSGGRFAFKEVVIGHCQVLPGGRCLIIATLASSGKQVAVEANPSTLPEAGYRALLRLDISAAIPVIADDQAANNP